MASEERIASVGCLVDGNATITASVATQSIKRRNVGRAARRRRRKLRDIQSVFVGNNVVVDQESVVQPNLSNQPTDAVKSISLGSEESSSEAKPSLLASSSSPAVLPADRSCVAGPAVVQHRHVNQWSSHDERALQAQLGYVPGNAIRIAARVKNVATFFSQSSTMGMATIVDDAHDTKVGRLVAAATEETDTDTMAKARTDHAQQQLQQQPVVVQLYPLVWREPHAGGKAGGLRFKARKRQKQPDKSPSTSGSSTSHDVSSSVDDGNVVIADADTEDPSLQSSAAKMKESSTEAAAAADMAPDDDEQGSISDTNWLVEPFPTIYWLTHPTLHAAIAELERDGYGVHYEQRLAADTVALDCMRRAHTTYGKERWLLLSSTDQAYIQRRNWHESAFSTQRGVAGSTNPNAVKCLHAHTAHYLSGCTDNVIGQWAMEAVNDKKQKKQAERRED